MYLVNLGTIENVKKFTDEILKINSCAVLKSQKSNYLVDAKSIMGIFSLDLTQLLVLEIYGEECELIQKLKDMEILIEFNKTN